jgi:hypothetical protein
VSIPESAEFLSFAGDEEISVVRGIKGERIGE